MVQTQTCEITNDDQPGTILVKKIVKNDDGGTKTAGDFTFRWVTPAPVAFVEDVQDSLRGEKSVSVSAGTYTVIEPGVDGLRGLVRELLDIVVGNGETKTCTITNDDQPGTIIVKKVVENDNGGTKKAADFSFQVATLGAATRSSKDGRRSARARTTVSSRRGSVHGRRGGRADRRLHDLVRRLRGRASANGETKTCTITNDDQPGTIIVKKVVKNDDGGTKKAA